MTGDNCHPICKLLQPANSMSVVNYHFLLDDIPVPGIPVNIRVTRQGEYYHQCELVKKRHMIGDTRVHYK